MSGGGPLKSFVVYPQRSTKAGVLIVIHEIFGLTEWVRAVSDQLAQHGFIAVAPDLLSGKGPNGGGTDSLGDRVGQTIQTLAVNDVIARLNAVRDYAAKIPAANGRVGSIGFCWGGGMSFQYAMRQPQLNAAVTFYGPMPSDPSEYRLSRVPILGLYGGADERVNANIEIAQALLGDSYIPNVYFEAGHGFLRQQREQKGANLRATEMSWGEAISFLQRTVDGGGRGAGG
jgi:carboxymethylenebutenolidase